MRVQLVGIKPSEAMEKAGVPALCPELLASVGARYSRNGEGLLAILEKIEHLPEDQAIEAIFRHVDYGHQSIADMAPVAMFIDQVSMALVLQLWLLGATAAGQETSTRYVKMDVDRTMAKNVKLAMTGLDRQMKEMFDCYHHAVDAWKRVGELEPERMNIPQAVLESDDWKDELKRDRYRRNFAFDRSRYFLPLGALTNVMMLTSARSWVQIIQWLLSSEWGEAVELGVHLVHQLRLVAPQMVRHATFKDPVHDMIMDDRQRHLWGLVHDRSAWHLVKDARLDPLSPDPFLRVHTGDQPYADIIAAAKHHRDRYDGFGQAMQMVSVRFGWWALPIGEIRDLNRHRTGSKAFPLLPVGLYLADDEVAALPSGGELGKCREILMALRGQMAVLMDRAWERARSADYNFVYWLPLGTQCRYEHVTTADKFLYQCQLRTGNGAHYQYAARHREVLELWHQQFPETREFVRPGTAEPE